MTVHDEMLVSVLVALGVYLLMSRAAPGKECETCAQVSQVLKGGTLTEGRYRDLIR